MQLLRRRGARRSRGDQGAPGPSNRALALVLSQPTVLKIFQIAGLDKRFSIYPSLAAAMQAEAGARV